MNIRSEASCGLRCERQRSLADADGLRRRTSQGRQRDRQRAPVFADRAGLGEPRRAARAATGMCVRRSGGMFGVPGAAIRLVSGVGRPRTTPSVGRRGARHVSSQGRRKLAIPNWEPADRGPRASADVHDAIGERRPAHHSATPTREHPASGGHGPSDEVRDARGELRRARHFPTPTGETLASQGPPASGDVREASGERQPASGRSRLPTADRRRAWWISVRNREPSPSPQ